MYDGQSSKGNNTKNINTRVTSFSGGGGNNDRIKSAVQFNGASSLFGHRYLHYVAQAPYVLITLYLCKKYN